MNSSANLAKEGRWECYSKYIEQNCFSYFLSMQCIIRCHLAMVALSDCQEAMVSKVTPVGPLDAEKTVESDILYVIRIAFTASLFTTKLIIASHFSI